LPQTNGFVERFIRTVKEEFFKRALRQTFYNSVAALQANLDVWLVTTTPSGPIVVTVHGPPAHRYRQSVSGKC
jgi:transposase InsO family protein